MGASVRGCGAPSGRSRRSWRTAPKTKEMGPSHRFRRVACEGTLHAGFDGRLEDLARRALPKVSHDLGVSRCVRVPTIVDGVAESPRAVLDANLIVRGLLTDQGGYLCFEGGFVVAWLPFAR
jgi:hypothetical protein